MKKRDVLFLKFGTLQTILMAAYHFYLPFQYTWSNYFEKTGKTIEWSLYALNNYFSFNLLVIALFLGYYLFKKSDKTEIIKILTWIIFLFWVFSILYQLIEPMPLPEHLSWLGMILIGVAFLNGLLFLIPLVSFYRKI